jgi:PAS domain S-box-containing protein
LTLILHQRDSDRRDLLEQKERAETEQRRFEALATGSPVGVWQNDADGNCVYVNPRGCEITGLTVEQIMAQGWRQAIHAEDREAVAVAWSRAEANGQPFHCEYRISRPDGNVVWVLGLAVPLVDAAGKRVGHVGTLTDITKSKLQQDEISDLNLNLETRVAARTAALERANRELESFSYSVSHDLRAPLRAINGYAKVLLDEERGRLGEEGQRMLDRIAYNADRMGELIDDILDYSRVGRSEMHLRDVDLERLLGHVVARLRESHPRVKFFSSGLPVVLGDATMLEQILQNLLDNACTYTANTEDPRIEIAAETRAGEQLILVRDNGVGFDMEHAGRLFGLFQRLHAPVGRDGTGVGLAIVKRLVERHGGRIWAESAPGEGACFYFSLAAMPTGDAASGEVSSDA